MNVDRRSDIPTTACARSLPPDLTPQHRFTGLSLAVLTSAQASPRQCGKHAAYMRSPRGPIGGGNNF
jgi:hypothetical protein